MQIYTALIALHGNLNKTVWQTRLTAAHIAVIRHLHGPEAICGILLAGEEPNLDKAGLLQRLREHSEAFAWQRAVMQTFPGDAPKLPETVEEIGLSPAQIDAPPPEAPPWQ